MMVKSINLSKISEYVRPKRVRVVPTVSVIRTILRNDGLLDSVVERIERPKDQYRDQNWRNFQIQTIIQVGSTDLLKEVDSIALTPLAGADGVTSFSSSLSDLHDLIADLRSKQSISTPTSSIAQTSEQTKA